MSSSTCYNPDWTPFTSPAFQPCDQFNNVYSMCCGTNHTDDGVARDICEPSGLCLGQFFNSNGSYLGPADWREGCTDQTWQSPNCLRNVCTDPSTGGVASGNSPLTPCPDGTWCCGEGNQQCRDNKQGFSLTATLGSAATSTATITTTSTIPSTTTASTTPSNSLSHAGIALITIGVVFLIAAIIAFFFLYRKIDQKRRRDKATSQTGAGRVGQSSAEIGNASQQWKCSGA